MNTLQQNILNILAYFDIFHYPLKNEEIKSYLPQPYAQLDIDAQLSVLQANNIIYRIDEFYSLRDDLFLAVRRRNGNRAADAEFSRSIKAARILFRFPFVEGLAISGSLSKNFADETTDIDFFIITKANRLWIARTIMHVFYKLAAAAGKQRMFCMNYYVDEAALEIPEKNIFTAMEIVTLIPMQGTVPIKHFMQQNIWVKKYFPLLPDKTNDIRQVKKGIPGRMVQKILGGSFGSAVDNWLHKITGRHWQKKEQQRKVNPKGISIGMLAGKHFAKPDPKNFQQKILVQYETKIKSLTEQLNKMQIAVP